MCSRKKIFLVPTMFLKTFKITLITNPHSNLYFSKQKLFLKYQQILQKYNIVSWNIDAGVKLP